MGLGGLADTVLRYHFKILSISWALPFEVLHPLTYERTFRNGPRKVEHRYIEEEVPYNLVTLERLGRIAGVETPTVSRIIDIYNIMRNRDYRTKNTMAETLGLDGMGRDEILEKIRQGYSTATTR